MVAGNFTRGRRVEYLARDHLREQGYCVVRTAGARSPVDLVAGKRREVLFVRTLRLRSPVADVREVATRFRGDIVRLQEVYRRVELPVQFWIFTDREGWRFFDVRPGGISEVRGVCV